MTETSSEITSIVCAQCTEEVPNQAHCEVCGEPTALDGRYRLLNTAGNGSFGTTYRAKRLDDGRIVAIKEMLVRRADTLKAVELFEREAQVLKRLDHPGIPSYYDDFWHEDGRSTAFFLVQEFIEGRVIGEIYDGGPSRPQEVVEIVADLLETLKYLHEFSPPVVHRDIKPANLMQRQSDDSVVLIDFGSVQAAVSPEEGESTVVGTFGYMAPEQFRGNAGPKSDVFGVAATATALLSGQSPDYGPGSDPSAELSKLNIAPRFRDLLTDMLAQKPEDRPTAHRAASQLEKLSSDGGSPLASGKLDSASSTALTMAAIPEAPRPVPPDFEEQYGLTSSNSSLFQWIIVVIAILVLLGVLSRLSPALTVRALLVGILVGCVYFVFRDSQSGEEQTNAAQEIWRHGEVARGKPVDSEQNKYEFEVDGETFRGSLLPANRPELPERSSMPVLYLSDDPQQNLAVTESIAGEDK